MYGFVARSTHLFARSLRKEAILMNEESQRTAAQGKSYGSYFILHALNIQVKEKEYKNIKNTQFQRKTKNMVYNINQNK